VAGCAERAAHRGRQRAFWEKRAAAAFSCTIESGAQRHPRRELAACDASQSQAAGRYQTWYAARRLWGPACDLVSTLRPWRAGFQDNLEVARATRGWFRGAHSIGMIVKLAAQTTVNATALIITAFLLRGWIKIHPFVFRLRWRSRNNARPRRRLFVLLTTFNFDNFRTMAAKKMVPQPNNLRTISRISGLMRQTRYFPCRSARIRPASTSSFT